MDPKISDIMRFQYINNIILKFEIQLHFICFIGLFQRVDDLFCFNIRRSGLYFCAVSTDNISTLLAFDILNRYLVSMIMMTASGHVTDVVSDF